MAKGREYPARAMRSRHRAEKRRHPRYPLISELVCSELSSAGIPQEKRKTLQAEVQDASSGGLGARCNRPIKASELVRCEILLAGSSVRIPTLMQVRWTSEASGKSKYRLGLQFLL